MTREAWVSLGSMEGVYNAPVVEDRARRAAQAWRREALWPGYLLAAAVAALSYLIHYLPIAPFGLETEYGVRRPVSAAIIAIVCSVLLGSFVKLPGSVRAGSKSAVKTIIPLAIILAGAGVDLGQIARLGPRILMTTLACIVVATAAAFWFGRLFGVWRRTSLLIGAGTAICGTSAIVAVAPVIEAEDEEVTLAVGVVNLLGLVFMFALPAAGGLLGLGDDAYGVWAGTSVHAVPQAVAAGFAFSAKAGTMATLVKLVRVTLLAPFLFVLMFWQVRHRHAGGVTVHYGRLVPPFVWGFLAVAVVSTLGLFPSLQFQPAAWLGVGSTATLALSPLVVEAGSICLTLAIAAIGLEVNLRVLVHVGGRALLTGAAASMVLAGASLLLILFAL